MKMKMKLKNTKDRIFKVSALHQLPFLVVFVLFRLLLEQYLIINLPTQHSIILNVLLTYVLSEKRYSTNLDLSFLAGHLLVFQIFNTFLGFLKLVRQFLELLEDYRISSTDHFVKDLNVETDVERAVIIQEVIDALQRNDSAPGVETAISVFLSVASERTEDGEGMIRGQSASVEWLIESHPRLHGTTALVVEEDDGTEFSGISS